MKIYSQIISTLIDEIHKFGDVDPFLKLNIIKSESVDAKPPRPFFSYKLITDYQRQTFNDYNNEFWSLSIQIKSHADDSIQASDMAFSLRKILWSQQFLYDLSLKGMSVGDINTIPSLAIDFETRKEFTSGLDFTIYVNDGYQDLTQPGQIDSADFDITTKH